MHHHLSPKTSQTFHLESTPKVLRVSWQQHLSWQHPKWERAFWSLFCSLTRLAFLCLTRESGSTVNAIHAIPFSRSCSAPFLNYGQGLYTYLLPAGSFQRQISSGPNPSPAAQRVWSFLIHLPPSIYSGQNQQESRYVASLRSRQLFRAYLKQCGTEGLTALISLTSGAPLKEKKKYLMRVYLGLAQAQRLAQL